VRRILEADEIVGGIKQIERGGILDKGGTTTGIKRLKKSDKNREAKDCRKFRSQAPRSLCVGVTLTGQCLVVKGPRGSNEK